MQFRSLARALSAMLIASFVPIAHAQEMSADEKAIRELFQSITDAFHRRDAVGAMAPYSDDLVAFDIPPPRKTVGKASGLQSTEDFIAATEGPLIAEHSDIHIKVNGDVGYGRSLMRFGGTLKGGKKIEYWIRVSDGFEKRDGRWWIVHEHASLPVNLKTGLAVEQAAETVPPGRPAQYNDLRE